MLSRESPRVNRTADQKHLVEEQNRPENPDLNFKQELNCD